LDASELSSSEISWKDKSSNGNNAVKNGNPSLIINAHNGNSIMHYSGADNEFHSFSRINDIRTVFWVIRKEGFENYQFLLGDSTTSDFHQDYNNELFTHTVWQNFNSLSINGTISPISTSKFPSSLSVLSLITSKPLSASNFSKDRVFADRVFKGDLGELIIFNKTLNDLNYLKVEGYLAHKWGLTANLPADHLYKSKAP
jgi:hypothetical protein